VKAARLRPRAERDLLDAARYYEQHGGRRLAAKAFDGAVAALDSLVRMPGLGSPRIGQDCDVPGLLSWGITGFPMQWFYFEANDHLDVVRLLGDRQDIATTLNPEH